MEVGAKSRSSAMEPHPCGGCSEPNGFGGCSERQIFDGD
jgi:hypothetical protein